MARYPSVLPTGTASNLTVHAIAGTRVILVALNCPDAKKKDLMGFAFKREFASGPTGDWLRGLKVFKTNEPDPKPNTLYSTYDNPIQSFLWSDFTADPDTAYRFTITARYGKPGALQDGDTVTFEIRTEKADDGKHGIWFNRGSVASQAFAREFNNAAMTDAIANDPRNKMTVWLSRGLLEACLAFIDQTPAGDGLRVCAYEFTYAPVLNSLKKALDRGVDVRIAYHKTNPNDKAIAAAALPDKKGKQQVLFGRTHTKIPHNKFIVRMEGDRKPKSVWTGSTNFTPSGFLGQTNVGHLVTDDDTAQTYLDFWSELTGDPVKKDAVANATKLTPDPANVVQAGTPALVFSPRTSDRMLDWYAQRIEDAKTSVTFTGAFGVAPKILAGLQKKADSVRFILLEKPPTADIRAAQASNRDDLRVSYGAVLGQTYKAEKAAQGGKKLVPIPKFELDKWFLKEELARQDGSGFVFFIHTKFLLVDPLSDDPLVCTGSANFSTASLTANDENMLQIRGDTRVADIYVTEFDRIFRHFYFRDVANEVAVKGGKSKTIFLSETDAWADPYFDSTKFNCHRRLMFFADPSSDWVTQARKDPNAFAGSGSGKPKRQNSSGQAKKKRATTKSGKKKSSTEAPAKKRVGPKAGSHKSAGKSSTKNPAKKRATKKKGGNR